MKIQFKHQQFQADAAKAVCDVFLGQPYLESSYLLDSGTMKLFGGEVSAHNKVMGFCNQPLVPQMTDELVLKNLQAVQAGNLLQTDEKLDGRFNLTIEMETGTGKTYTYIKTMYELNKAYGWSKFIVVVPSIAIREGVYKSFQIVQEHFAEEYGKSIRFFIYNSQNLTEIDHFASDSHINVMIINAQAFNATGKDARRIYMKLDEFRSRRPIDIISSTNPILIIDEPQSVEGKKTKDRLLEFKPLMTLRYSATHRKDAIYNMVYRLDAMDAYNKRLVKKISVKGITATGSTATEGYLYLEKVQVFTDKNPVATLEFDYKGKNGLLKKTANVSKGFNLYEQSGELEEYKDNYVVTEVDGRDNSITFANGKKLLAGEYVGVVNEDQLRRIQIRETIISHFERERALFSKGIKVLSLFFIDEVKKYRDYDAADEQGVYAKMFEEEYDSVRKSLQQDLFESPDYLEFLDKTVARKAHAGYFSIDKSKKGAGRFKDCELKKGSSESDDVDAYDLIMKDKERLLSREEPVRFIFSHSALKEGWDNQNVFQICTLKSSGSEVRKRQEVGRGLRLCVNQNGERMDTAVLGADVHSVNVLTVIANESYEDFAKALQTEMAENIGSRPVKVTIDLFKGRKLETESGVKIAVSDDLAQNIYDALLECGYVKKGMLTEAYRVDKAAGTLHLSEEVAQYTAGVCSLLDTLYDPDAVKPDDARKNNVELRLNKSKFGSKEFKDLWNRINAKSAYVVDFDTDELILKSINALNEKLRVTKIFFKIDQGSLKEIKSKEQLENGNAFKLESTENKAAVVTANSNVKYDLVGKIVEGTQLTRKVVVDILRGIHKPIFDQFQENPEEFIIKASRLINEQKATVIVEHITYNKLEARYETNIFTDNTMKGKLGMNACETHQHLYDHLIYDSTNERDFAQKLEASKDVSLYIKLPKGFFINTPVGNYNPDWAIAFHEGSVKHVYFVAETKGSMSTLELREIESAKIKCARKHFAAISSESVTYDVVDSYEKLLDLVK
ncbi:type III restriction enzyme [Fibrobacter sp. UWH5]|uniref:type III restriction-modification system endonuclease n=1 Tax=Fibrobacter sp. UWH5 TaxID=1896211 RepID=UPI00091F8711|nr:DEAD/DEAH box helicase family protein [Fibrobacter sp. UWH5]SHL46609.1 type III restriction enzyme [Fibrobacter sp. UWH5]